jgi:hypothetical protein
VLALTQHVKGVTPSHPPHTHLSPAAAAPTALTAAVVSVRGMSGSHEGAIEQLYCELSCTMSSPQA